MDGDAADLRENEDVKEFYLGIAGEGSTIVPRRKGLQAPQALAGLTTNLNESIVAAQPSPR